MDYNYKNGNKCIECGKRICDTSIRCGSCARKGELHPQYGKKGELSPHYGKRGKASSNWRHGFTGTPEHKAWHDMIQRCTNPRDSAYHYYGGRGITVCKEW